MTDRHRNYGGTRARARVLLGARNLHATQLVGDYCRSARFLLPGVKSCNGDRRDVADSCGCLTLPFGGASFGLMGGCVCVGGKVALSERSAKLQALLEQERADNAAELQGMGLAVASDPDTDPARP